MFSLYCFCDSFKGALKAELVYAKSGPTFLFSPIASILQVFIYYM